MNYSVFWILFLAVPLAGLGQESQNRQPHETISLPETSGERPDAATPDLAAVERLIIERTNTFREKQGREPVATSKALKKAAQEFARYMAESGRYGHRADGHTPAERITAAGYEYCIVRENIAYAFRSTGFSSEQLAEQFMTGWKESPGHRRNMLARHVTETAVAIAKTEDSDIYLAVQLFARPRGAAVEFVVKNEADFTVTYRMGDREFPLPPRLIRMHELCVPKTVVFLSLSSDEQAADPPARVARIKPADGERLVVMPAEEGYRVEVRREDNAPSGSDEQTVSD